MAVPPAPSVRLRHGGNRNLLYELVPVAGTATVLEYQHAGNFYGTSSTPPSGTSLVTTTSPKVLWTGLPAGDTFFAWGRIRTSGGWSDWSGPLRSVVGDYVPAPPNRPYPTSITPNSITVASEPNTDNQLPILTYQFRLQRWTGSAWITDGYYNSNNVITFSNLRPYTTYAFSVNTQNSAGWGNESAVGQATTKPDVPNPPKLPGAINITNTSVDIYTLPSDSEVAPIIRYEFEVRQWTGSNWQVFGTYPTTSNSIKLTNLEENTEYSVNAKVQNETGWSDTSSTKLFKTEFGVPKKPLPPIVSSVKQTTAIVTAQENLEEPAEILEYRLTLYTLVGSNYVNPVSYSTTSPVFEITGLKPYTRYGLIITARNVAGWSESSESASFSTEAGSFVMTGGVWKGAIPHVYTNGAWQMATPMLRSNGVWREIMQ